MKKKYLVTGASGFVGSCLARELVEKDQEVHILARKTSDIWRISDIKENLFIHDIDLMDEYGVKKLAEKNEFDIVYHLATYGGYHFQKELDKIIDTNIIGTWNLFKSCSDVGVEMFVNTSSSSEYGEKNIPMKEDMILVPNNMYGASKASSTILCSTYAKLKKIPLVTYRLFSPYGYYDDSTRLIPTVIRSCLDKKNINLGNKESKRDFIFIEDVVDAYINAINFEGTYGEILNIGSGNQYSIEEVVNTIINITDSKVELNWGKVQGRQYEPKVWCGDISKIREKLDWTPKISIEAGLEKTIDWFRLNKHLY